MKKLTTFLLNFGQRCLVWTALGLLLTPFSIAQTVSSTRQIQDLSYGDALFYFYKGDYFSSATRLLVAQEQATLEHHVDDAEILLGGLYLSYGQQDQAEQIFSRLLNTTKPKVKDRAWLYLAEIAWQRGNSGRAEEALKNMGDDLDQEFIARKQLLVARLAIDAQKFDRAISVLSEWRGGDELATYARYNLGVALIRHGRVDEGSRYLEEIGGGRIATRKFWSLPEGFKFWSSKPNGSRDKPDEQLALRDKANLALGFAYLQKNQSASALDYLTRISANSAHKNKASLAAGWAASELGDYDAALLHWDKLREGDRLDPAVQEALLAIPYAKRNLGDGGQAIEQYQRAISQFEVEIEHLESFKGQLDHGAFLKALLADDDAGTVGWFWRLQSIPDSPESRYLYHLVADHSFQEGLKNYRDLVFLQENLRQWRDNIGVYRNMLEAQETRFQQGLTIQPGEGVAQQLAVLASRFEKSKEQLETIQQNHDTTALLNSQEQGTWDRLSDMEQRLSVMQSSKADGAKHKHRILKGLMLWDAQQNYAQRLWQARKEIKQLEKSLEKGHELNHALNSAKSDSPNRFSGFSQRIDQIAPRIDALLNKIDVQLGQHQSYLAALAGNRFDQHKKRLTAYLAEAQFALATAYDASAAPQDSP